MTYYIINALIGAAVALLIAYVGRSNIYVLAGLIPLFPTFTLFAHVNAYHIGGTPQLKEVLIFGVISIFAYLVYVGVMYICVHQGLKFIHAASISIIVWAIAALNVYLLAKKHLAI